MNRRSSTSIEAQFAGLPQSESGEGMIVVDLALHPMALDSGAEAILKDLNRSEAGQEAVISLPPELQEILNSRHSGAPGAMKARVSVGDREFSCHVFWVEPRNGEFSTPMLALHLKGEGSVSEPVRKVARAYHLTGREEEALLGLAMGLTSKGLAKKMSISPNTVNAFLRLIMVKMGVTSRAGVMGKLLDESPHLSGRQEWQY